MKRSLATILGATALAACQSDPAALTGAAPARTPAAPTFGRAASTAAIPGQYIVLLREGGAKVPAAAAALVAKGKGRIRHVYTSGLIDGFAAELDDSTVAIVRRDPSVVAVVPDVEVTATGTQFGAPWGLDRLDQTALPLNGSYTYANDGSGVTVYIVDTGINYTHVDFGGRAAPGYDAITSGGGAVDCHGHGTHVAGTVGGAAYGVAKAAALVGVRVLDCSGSGSSSGVIAGLDWVLRQKQAAPSRPMVVNMSLSGTVSSTLDNAVANLTAGGVTVVVAAGNESVDACTESPARAPSAITVAATDAADGFASFSNSGSCVDLEAPGVNITSDYIGSATATALMSGTSMASPHAAGAAALYLAAHPGAAPAQVSAALVANASAGVVVGTPASTANRVLNVAFLGTALPPAPVVSLSTAGATLTAGQSTTLTATVTNPVSGGSLSWIARNSAVATAAGSAGTTATVTGVGSGSTYVVAVYTTGGTVVRDSALVTVTAPVSAPTTGTAGGVVSATGVGCMSAHLESGAGSWVAVATCATGSAAQTWSAPAVGNTGTVTTSTGLCLDSYDGSITVTDSCTGAASQQWTATAAGELRTASGYCATLDQQSWGVRVTSTPCNGDATQRWTLPGAGASPAPAPAPSPAPSPTPGAGAIASSTGLGCVTAQLAAGAGAWVAVAGCSSGSDAQTWTVPATGATGSVKTASGLCLESYDGSVTLTNVCSGASGQQWSATAAGELRTASGYCATLDQQNWGARLVSSPCSGASTQRWTLPSGGTSSPAPAPAPSTASLVSATGLGCATAHLGSGAGSWVAVATCATGDPAQTWTAPPSGSTGTVTTSSGLCLEAYDGSVALTNACSGSTSQQWSATAAGELRTASGYCATVDQQGWGVRVLVSTCSGATTQRWTR